MSWWKCQHPGWRQTQHAIRDRSWPRSEHVLLTSKAHDDEPDAARDSDLGDVLGRRSDAHDSFDGCWRAHLGDELLDLLLGSFDLGPVVRVQLLLKAFKPLERSDHMNEQQRNIERLSESRGGAHVRQAPVFEVDRCQDAAYVDPRRVRVRRRLFGRRCDQHWYSCLAHTRSVVDPSSILR